MNAAVLLLLAHLQEPQGDALYTVRTEDAAGETKRVLVSADRRSVDCHAALQALGNACGWNVIVETRPLENELHAVRVDLAFDDQEPRVVGQLIAVAAGADAILDPGDPRVAARPTLHVVRRPDGATESGRQRLRALGAQWYRSFLTSELQHEPIVADAATRVRMDLGSLLVESGDLEAAIPFFARIWETRPNEQVATAVVRTARCFLDLAAGERDREMARGRFEDAERWSRRLLENLPNAPEAAGATVALGEALLGQAACEPNAERARKLVDLCRTELTARTIRLADTPEALDVWLLVGEAWFRLGRPESAYESMLTLRESRSFGDLSERQFRDYHFLLGFGATGAAKPELGMKALEWFLVHAPADPRRGMAYVLLGESYLGLSKFVEARAAAVEARDRHMGAMKSDWRRRALKLWARTALALGDKETAFQEMEVLVHREDDPELILFVVDEMLADRQWQRAVSAARLLAARDGADGDAARFKTVQAYFDQAKASGSLAEFPGQAIQLAPKIADPELRAKTATLVGDAYTAAGKFEHAADAYRGILR